jgi:hypothetical protein
MVFGQTTTPTEKDKKGTDEPAETIVLSPFVVDASKDQGYHASSTLAGSRINTDLKDLSAPITVVTAEFIKDLSATGVNDILAFTVNTEGSRDFTSTTLSGGVYSDNLAGNPQTANRIRGLASADITRDYFHTISGSVGFDTYNLDQVTISRGPNSVLAGLGSPSGLINYSPQLATFGKTQASLSYRLGSFNDNRASFNSNTVIKPNVLAVRVAGVWSQLGFEQRPAFSHDNRGYLAVTYQPTKKTTIRASYEKVQVLANNPNSITPVDDVSQWLALGKPSYNANNGPLSTKNSLLQSGGNTDTVLYNKNGTIDRAVNSRALTVFGQGNLPGGPDLWTPSTMSGNLYGDWHRYNTNASLTNHQLDALLLSVDQEILPDFYANLAYTHERFHTNDVNNLGPGSQNYRVDVDETLPSASGPIANPHFGETYFFSRALDNFSRSQATNNAIRATLNYNLDLTKINKWLGNYKFTGFYEDRETRSDGQGYSGWRTDRPATQQFANLLEAGTRSYVGGTAANGYHATSTPITPHPVTSVPELNATFAANGDVLAPFADTLSYYYFLVSTGRTVEKLASSAVVAQGYFWDGRIVPMIGIRHDKQQQGSLGLNQNQANPSTGLLAPISSDPVLSSVSKTTKSYGVVVHPTKWLSAFYNHSENFIPDAAALDLLGHPSPSPTGIGRDWGFAVDLIENKLNLKVNWYKLDSANARNTIASGLGRFTVAWAEQSIEPNLAAQLGIPYKRAMEASLFAGDPRLGNSYKSDQAAKGVEIELTYNVTKNWRVMGSVSQQQVVETNIAPGLTAFLDERLAYWKSVPGLWTGLKTKKGGAPDGDPWALEQTGEEFYNQFILGDVLRYKAEEGKPTTQLAKWHASGLTNYTFGEGALKGLSIGGGGRSIDKANIGAPVIKNSAGVITALDEAHAYYSKGYISFDAWVGYETRLTYLGNRKVTFQLNGRDLQENGGYRPIAANSNGTHSAYRIVQPRTFYLTTTVEF